MRKQTTNLVWEFLISETYSYLTEEALNNVSSRKDLHQIQNDSTSQLASITWQVEGKAFYSCFQSSQTTARLGTNRPKPTGLFWGLLTICCEWMTRPSLGDLTWKAMWSLYNLSDQSFISLILLPLYSPYHCFPKVWPKNLQL